MDIITSANNRKCIIHVGMAKTGTSAIQMALQGYNNGRYRYAKLGFPNHSIPFMCMFAQDYLDKNWLITREGATKNQLADLRVKFKENLAKELENCREDIIIFSGENIARYSEQSLVEMKRYLDLYFDEYEIIYYVREPLDWVKSVFQQRVQDYSGDIPFPLTKEYRLNPEHRQQITRFTTLFSADCVSVYAYEDARKQPHGIVGHFLRKIGISDVSGVNTKSVINPSISSEALRLTYIFNTLGLITTNDKRLYLARMHLINYFKKIAVEHDPIPIDYFKDVLEYTDQAWLEQKYGISYRNYEFHNTGRLEQALTEVSLDTSQRLKGVLETLRKVSHERMVDKQNLQILFFEIYSSLGMNQ